MENICPFVIVVGGCALPVLFQVELIVTAAIGP